MDVVRGLRLRTSLRVKFESLFPALTLTTESWLNIFLYQWLIIW